MKFGSFFKKDDENDSHIEINQDTCKGCEKCITACPNHVLILSNSKSKVNNPLACKRCRICQAICPNESIQVN